MGADVFAVADGIVKDVSAATWPGSAIVIEHTLPSAQKVYSVYIHVDDAAVLANEVVSRGQKLGTVQQQPYNGRYPEYHTKSNGELVADSHLHFEIRYFGDGSNIYTSFGYNYPACNGQYAARAYTPPDVHPDNFPAPGAGYTDPTNFVVSHAPSTPTPAATNTPVATATAFPVAQGTLPSHIGSGPGIVTVSNLIPGMQYRIVVSGVVNFNSVLLVDPQWHNYQATYGCFCQYGPRVSFDGVNLAAQNGQVVFDPGHTYTFLWIADDSQLQMYITDSVYSDNSGSFTYQIFEDAFLGTPTSVPTSIGSTSTPQPTVTPQPTATLNPCSNPCTLDCILSWFGISSTTTTATNFHTVSYSIQQALFDIQLFHRVEDEILSQTPQGQHYIDHYYGHGIEITEILRNNSELRDEAIATLQLWEPNLQALVDGNGDTVTITSGQVQAIQDFLDHLSVLGSPSLQQTIASERANTPLEAAIGMKMDQAWTYLNGFPNTPILDNFNRANGAIGSNWSGNKSKYAINANQLKVISNNSNSDIYWSSEAFEADQEAYVTFADVSTIATEQDLLLKAQSATTWGDGVLEVLYDAVGQRVQVWTYEWPAGWVQYGADIPVTFVNGDQFGARAYADGTVEVYKNGTLLAARDVSSWSYYDQGGYIGLWFIDAQNVRLDDFGGGTLPSASMATSSASQVQANSASADSLDVDVSGTSAFWQGVPLNETASVTITQIQTGKQTLSLKPKSNGMWGEGVVQVFYDLAHGRVQLWVYDPAKGWVQIGKDIPVKFSLGDRFTVRTLEDGTVEIVRNGKLLAKADVSP